MKLNKFIFVFILLLSISAPLTAAVGESAVITLVFPYGARSTGMGECGTAMTDNEAALFYNPAGLAVRNRAWKGGSVSSFYERLLPEFNIPDLWHHCISINYQPEKTTAGGFGYFNNHLNMGNDTPDYYSRGGRAIRSTEDVFALGWGFNFNKTGISNNNFGLTFKYINSRLAPEMEDWEGIGQTFAIDFGYLRTSRTGLRFGFTAMNMGPNIFYVDKNNSDPLPFTINLAIAFEKRIFYDENINISVVAETRCDRELVTNSFDGNPEPFYKAIYTDIKDTSFKANIEECNLHTGFELGIMNTGFFRMGYLIDRLGNRFERTIGFGVRVFNHFNFDYSYIHSPEGYMRNTIWPKDGSGGSSGVRHRQTRISFTYASCLRSWTEDDLKWWKSR